MTTVRSSEPGANAPELTKSLPPQHGTVTSRMNNQDMRSPSDMRGPVSRTFLLRAVLGALLAALTVAPIADAARSGGTVSVSKGVGRQIFTGGGGVAYGNIFSGGSLVVADYSPAHDIRVDSPATPTVNADGSRTYVPPPGMKIKSALGYKISGTLYRVTLTGATTFNAAAIYGRLQVRGKGTLLVNGVRSRWNGPATLLGRPPKDIRKLFQYALTGAPPPVDPPPPATTPTTTDTTVRPAGA
jgi:hypothetical protein